MGAVSGLLGVGGGAGGSGFSGPQAADITKVVDKNQAQTAYTANQQALAQQQALVNAVAAQNGLQNQANVYGQLSNVAAGQGPNPAQAQLAQATGANTANQAALMAGQRGASANPALIARQAAMQGGANQQNAAGQAASLQAQQSLGALESMGNLANQQATQQINTTQGLTAAQQAEQQQLLNQITAQNNAAVGMQSNINQSNAGLAGQVMQGQQGLIGGLLNAGGGAAATKKAEGGMIEQPEAGGSSGPQSMFGKWAASNFNKLNPGAQELQKGVSSLGNFFSSSEASPKSVITTQDVPSEDTMYAAEGGKVPAMVSPGEQYLPPRDVKKVVNEGKNPLEVGEKIPGKPKFKGNDYRNDTVSKTLEAGGMVIPNEVMQSKNPHISAMKFVHAHIAKHRGKLPKGK